MKSNLDNVSDKFDFKRVHEKEVKQEIMNLNSKKQHATVLAIAAKILEQFCDSYLPVITKIINKSVTERTFPSELKLAKVTPVFKKLDCKTRRITDLFLFCPICPSYLKVLYSQINHFMKDKLSNIYSSSKRS